MKTFSRALGVKISLFSLRRKMPDSRRTGRPSVESRPLTIGQPWRLYTLQIEAVTLYKPVNPHNAEMFV